MHFERFEIRNFKGIEHAVLDLVPRGASIFTLIGLNESGKTTILEALSTFSLVKEETGALYAPSATRIPPSSYVPKTRKSDFTGGITVNATVAFDDGEKRALVKRLFDKTGARFLPESIPDKFSVVRGFSFDSSDYKRPIYNIHISPRAIPKGGRKDREVEVGGDLWKSITAEIAELVPQIIYFPTFIFTQPDKIYLNKTKDETAINRLYRKIVEDVAASLDHPLDVQKHIVNRIVNEETLAENIINMMFLSPDKQQQVAAALSEMSANITENVFDSWSKIFGGEFSGREIILQAGIDAGEDGEKLVYVQFLLKDGKSTYGIGERSLGFRWFFSFLLFTLYRASTGGNKPVLFLLDEPASNLHSRAQMQLLESLPKISTGSNQILYSTHSHYLVNPEWLDQAFIISNAAIDYDRLDEGNKSYRGRPTNIQVHRYRTFVGRNPDKTTYFQPVLDKLDVAPSKLDLVRPSVLVEGKGDYVIIEYGRRVILQSTSKVAVVPTRGAAGMNELIGLFLGWGVQFGVCLDDDKAGRAAAEKYKSEWGLDHSLVWTLGDIHSSLSGANIERFLDSEDIDLIQRHFDLKERPNKGQIQLYFSEKLARREIVDMSPKYFARIEAFEAALSGSTLNA